MYHPGIVMLFGSGEIAPSARRVYDWLFQRLPSPVQVAVLETPAGFQPNCAAVAGKVVAFLRQHVHGEPSSVFSLPARRLGTPLSPNDPTLLAPLLRVSAVFLGPGSPTYAARQLHNTLAWHLVLARHRLGAAIILASAGTFAASRCALPVYEIYKVGEDLHWVDGLDFFAPFGLSLALIPHWNNTEGGAELDTSHGFIGRERFERLLEMLPPDITVVGIDEHTAMVADLDGGTFRVMGRGGVTVLRAGQEAVYARGHLFSLGELGRFHRPTAHEGIPPEVWERVLTAQAEIEAPPPVPEDVQALVDQREVARGRRDWAQADALRGRIAARGWQVSDTPAGPRLEPA